MTLNNKIGNENSFMNIKNTMPKIDIQEIIEVFTPVTDKVRGLST